MNHPIHERPVRRELAADQGQQRHPRSRPAAVDAPSDVMPDVNRRPRADQREGRLDRRVRAALGGPLKSETVRVSSDRNRRSDQRRRRDRPLHADISKQGGWGHIYQSSILTVHHEHALSEEPVVFVHSIVERVFAVSRVRGHGQRGEPLVS